jgi:hypothetical protein
VKTIDLVAKLDAQRAIHEAQFCYAGFDPFTGDFSLFGPLSTFMHGAGKPFAGFLDELGLVVGQYFLATQYDEDDVLEMPLGLGADSDDVARPNRDDAALGYEMMSPGVPG